MQIERALAVIDVQESFRHRPYYRSDEVPSYLARLQRLIDGAHRSGIPVLQVFHIEDTGDFSIASGHVTAMRGLAIEPSVVFHKRSHSAMVGTGLDVWLTRHHISRLIVCGIRTEQCCETTTRHASDLGFDVDYVTEATLTFPMIDRSGREWRPDEIAARTELVLADRFARIVDIPTALA